MEITDNPSLFQTVFNTASNGIGVLKPIYATDGTVEDFTILLLNPVTIKRLGNTDYKGKRYSEVFTMADETGIMQKFVKVIETGISDKFERYYNGEGMQHWFRFTAEKYDQLLIITATDITSQKNVEQNLKNALEDAEKQRRLHESVTNNTPDLVYVFDLEYRFSYANKALLAMWGKSAEDAIGKGLRENGYEEWHALMHEREIDQIIANQKPVRGTVSFPHAELGDRIYDYILVPVLDASGNVEAIAGTTRDITDIKHAEERMLQSETRFKSMINQTPAPTLILMGKDLIIEQINQSMLKMIGHDEDVIGQPLLGVMPELEGSYIWNEVVKVYDGGTPFNQTEVHVTHRRTGVMKDYYYNIAYRPLKEGKKIIGMIQVAIDVTEQVIARKKLEQSESRFRALVNASSDMIYSMDADWKVMQHLDGRVFVSNTEMPISDWIGKHVHHEDRRLVENTINEAVSSKKIYELEHRVITADGSVGWTFSRAVPIVDQNGNITEWFGSAADITSAKSAQEIIKQSEEDLRNLVLQSPTGICVLDAKTFNCEIANDKFVQIADKPYEAIIGGHYWDVFKKVANSHKTELEQLSATGQPFSKSEVELLVLRNGVEQNLYLTFVYEPMREPSGAVNKIIVFVIDNTPQVQARRKIEESEARYRTLSETLELQVAERTRELQRSNEDLQQFAHVASHDLKEPVRKIRTFTGRLAHQLEGILDDVSLRYLDRIDLATERMYTMIDGVLAYSTINAAPKQTEMVSLNEVIKNIEIDLEVALETSNGQIQHDELPAVEGAPVLLYQLFYNLINNSLKFARPDVPPSVSITSSKANDGMVNITVKDNGIGFDPQYSGRIFETFTRLNPKDKFEGTGLGLSLCKKIAERHGGKINAGGKLDEGAEFTILLPQRQEKGRI